LQKQGKHTLIATFNKKLDRAQEDKYMENTYNPPGVPLKRGRDKKPTSQEKASTRGQNKEITYKKCAPAMEERNRF